VPFLQVQLPHEHVRPSGTLSATPVYPKMVATKIYFKPPQTEMQVFTFKPSLNFLVPKALHDIFCKQQTFKPQPSYQPTNFQPCMDLLYLWLPYAWWKRNLQKLTLKLTQACTCFGKRSLQKLTLELA